MQVELDELDSLVEQCTSIMHVLAHDSQASDVISADNMKLRQLLIEVHPGLLSHGILLC